MELGIIIGILVFFLGIIMGLPLCWVFLASTMVASVLIGSSFSFMAGATYYAIDNSVLLAMAFFILAGSLIANAGIADRLVRLSYVLVGRVKGGLVDVAIVATMFIGALTGSALTSIAALIPILGPRLEKYGYDRRYAAAAICCSGFMGYLIPPSIPALIYCLVAEQSVAAVFLSTVVPALILGVGYMALNYFICPRYMHPSKEIPPLPRTLKETAKEIKSATWSALPALGTPVVILGGIYGGIFTTNEAGAVAIVYTLVVGVFVYRELKGRTLWKCLKDTIGTLGMLTLLIAFATVFTRLLVREGVAQSIAESAMGLFQNKYMVLLMLNVLLLVLGMFLDGIPILLIVVPLVMPLVIGTGVNLVHLGSIVVFNIGVGSTTPPYAGAIFLGARLSGVPYDQLLRPMLWFICLVEIPVLFLVTYIPALSLWLPTVALGPKVVGAW